MHAVKIEFKDLALPSDEYFVEAREVLSRVGDKWSLYVIHCLSKKSLRFNELRREIDGISQRMLTLTLRGLERDGLVTRTVYATKPPRVDYELTSVGHTLVVPAMSLLAWAERNRIFIHYSRRCFDEQGVAAPALELRR